MTGSDQPKKWTTFNATGLGIRPCVVIAARDEKVLIAVDRREVLVNADRVHDTEAQAFVAHRRRKMLQLWTDKLRRRKHG